MTPSEQIKAWLEICSKATPGPWKQGCATSGHYIVDQNIQESLSAVGPEHGEHEDNQYGKVIADSDHIATFNPTTMRRILEAFLVMRETLEMYAGLDELISHEARSALAAADAKLKGKNETK